MIKKATVSITTRYAEAATIREDWPEAFKGWSKVCDLTVQKNDKPSKRAISRLKKASSKYARELCKAEDFDGADTVIKHTLDKLPGNLPLLIQYAEIATDRKDFPLALTRWKRVIEVSRSDGVDLPQKTISLIKKAFLKYSKKLIDNEDYGSAESALEVVLSVDPDDINTLTRYAVLAELRKKSAEALSRWQRVLDVAEQTGKLETEKIYSHLKKAKKEYALEQKPARINYVTECIANGDYNLADEALEQLLSELPEDEEVLRWYAKVAISRNDWEQAAKRWRSVLKVHSEGTVSVLISLAKSYRKRGMLDKAIEIIDGAVKCELSDRELIVLLAKLHSYRGDWEDAAALIDKLVEQNPDSFKELSFAIVAARVFWRLGNIDKASLAIEQAVGEKDIDELPLKTKAIVNEIRRRKNFPSKINNKEVSKAYYDEIYKDSFNYKASANDSNYLPVWEKVTAIIEKENCSSILDLGCGPGQFAEYITGKIPLNYTGVDFSKVAVESAKKKCPQATFIEADVLGSDIMQQLEYDVVVMLEVLEHIENDFALLDKIPKGKKVIASVPNFDSFGHVRFFKKSEDVELRYNNYFSLLKIIPVNLSDKSVIYIIDGIKKANNEGEA